MFKVLVYRNNQFLWSEYFEAKFTAEMYRVMLNMRNYETEVNYVVAL